MAKDVNRSPARRKAPDPIRPIRADGIEKRQMRVQLRDRYAPHGENYPGQIDKAIDAVGGLVDPSSQISTGCHAALRSKSRPVAAADGLPTARGQPDEAIDESVTMERAERVPWNVRAPNGFSCWSVASPTPADLTTAASASPAGRAGAVRNRSLI
jgi:hypothetical protein